MCQSVGRDEMAQVIKNKRVVDCKITKYADVCRQTDLV